MDDPKVEYYRGNDAVLLDLFTEIAILEHLVRLRFEPRRSEC